LTGHNPTWVPQGDGVADDPLVVYGVSDVWDQVDGAEEGDIESIVLAPDDLHKAGTSGGDPYAVAVPDLRADGELLYERHGLLFCFPPTPVLPVWRVSRIRGTGQPARGTR
jgi:hypothetical protein